VLSVSGHRFRLAPRLISCSRPLRDADAAKWLFHEALSNLSHPQPRVINTDLAPIYGSAIPDIKKEGRDTSLLWPAPTRTVLEQHFSSKTTERSNGA
jgi:transposase-like protein